MRCSGSGQGDGAGTSHLPAATSYKKTLDTALRRPRGALRGGQTGQGPQRTGRPFHLQQSGSSHPDPATATKPFLPPQCCCLLGDFPGPPALSKPCLGSRHRGWSPSSPTSTSKQKQQAVPRGGRGEQSPLNPGRSAGLTPKEPMGETGQKHKQRL